MSNGLIDGCLGLGGPSRCRAWLGFGALLVLVGMVALSAWLGYRQGVADASPDSAAYQAQIARLLEADRDALAGARRRVNEQLDALALRLGELQARMLRLDALGGRLVARSGLDATEFDFDAEPARGGVDAYPARDASPRMLIDDVARLGRLIDDRADKLTLLEQLLLEKELRNEVEPAGRPLDSGWVSARFGMRNDPFDGKRKFHHGIDFAARRGTPIRAVAAGVVVRSGPVTGFGNLVEIKHGNGLVTRYAHCDKTLAKVGEVVRRGQIIATVGSSGRSTGPHLHFEVLRDGQPVDPAAYVQLSVPARKG